jgi:S1-C subfamily serine protease
MAMWLTIRSGEQRGLVAAVDGKPFLLGRGEECDLTLEDAKVSRRHAQLEPLDDGRIMLRDLGSSNGTYVNGKRVETMVLSGREQLQLGDTVLVSASEAPGPSRGSTVLGALSGVFAGERPSAVYRLLLRRSRRATWLAVLAVLAAILFAALFGSGVVRPGTSSPIERVVREAARGTLRVQALRGGAPADSGTGWVLDRQGGLIVTNAHVVNGGDSFEAGQGADLQPATIVGVAPCDDLAVLRIRDAKGLTALQLGSQSTLKLGQTVVAVGYPVNASQEASLTSTTGVISVVRSSYREPALDVPRYPDVIQTDAPINPGNSGGPLLDLSGKVVGVASAARTLSADGRIIQGQNYAIGVDRVKAVTTVLRRGRSVSWTGASFDYFAASELRRRRLPPGLLVSGVVPGTPAAGKLRPGVLLVAANGMPVSSLAGYCDALAGIPRGATASFSVREPSATALRTLTLALG